MRHQWDSALYLVVVLCPDLEAEDPDMLATANRKMQELMGGSLVEAPR